MNEKTPMKVNNMAHFPHHKQLIKNSPTKIGACSNITPTHNGDNYLFEDDLELRYMFV